MSCGKNSGPTCGWNTQKSVCEIVDEDYKYHCFVQPSDCESKDLECKESERNGCGKDKNGQKIEGCRIRPTLISSNANFVFSKCVANDDYCPEPGGVCCPKGSDGPYRAYKIENGEKFPRWYCLDRAKNNRFAPEQQYCSEKNQCSDGIDNDGDGKIDYPNDPGCIKSDDDDESDRVIPPRCGDGKIDPGERCDGNNLGQLSSDIYYCEECSLRTYSICGDGRVGVRKDPILGRIREECDPPGSGRCPSNQQVCNNQYRCGSLPQCGDGKDNDGDNKIDYPDDPDCVNSLDPKEVSDVKECVWNALCENDADCGDSSQCGSNKKCICAVRWFGKRSEPPTLPMPSGFTPASIPLEYRKPTLFDLFYSFFSARLK